jgi:hypothetical protein
MLALFRDHSVLIILLLLCVAAVAFGQGVDWHMLSLQFSGHGTVVDYEYRTLIESTGLIGLLLAVAMSIRFLWLCARADISLKTAWFYLFLVLVILASGISYFAYHGGLKVAPHLTTRMQESHDIGDSTRPPSAPGEK